MPPKKLIPRLLPDSPTDEDCFGAHTRLANGIIRLIESNSGGQTISIEGEWGSGKSSVVKILQNRFNGPDELLHVYDAWIHSGDPLRRAFLTSMIEALHRQKWLNIHDGEWESELAKLSRRFKENTKRTLPFLTFFGKLFAGSLLLVPIGMSLFSDGLRRLSEYTEQSAYLSVILVVLILGALLALSPLLMVVGFACWKKCKGQKIDGMFELILNRTTLEEHTFTTETGDPTTIEFQLLFNKALNAAFSKKSKSSEKKLILVIDNLDRVSPSEAAEIWALLRSFVDMPQINNQDWARHFWVIVPVAKKAEELLSKTNDISAFHDKIFQARFALAKSNFKGWRDHLTKLLHRAFGEIKLTEEKRIIDLYMLVLKPGQSPTPRELVLFVNQLVTLYLQWEEQFPVSVLAAYTLESKGNDVKTQLMNRSIPSDPIKQLFGSDPRTEYACIYFNASERSNALEILQMPLAESALINGNGDLLFSEIDKEPSFSDIVGNILNTNARLWAVAEVDQFFRAVKSIYEARQILVGKGLQVAEHTANEISSLIVRVENVIPQCFSIFPSVPLLAPSFASAMILLLNETNNVKMIEAVKNLFFKFQNAYALTSQQINPYFKSPDDENIVAWLESFMLVAQHKIITEAIASSEVDLELPIPPARFSLLLSMCLERSRQDLYSRLEPLGSDEGLISYLEGDAQKASLKMGNLELIKWLASRRTNNHYEGLAAKVSEGLRSSLEIESDSLKLAMYIFVVLGPLSQSIKSTQKSEAETGVLMHHFSKTFARSEFSTAAAIAWCFVTEVHDISNVAQWNQSQDGVNILRSFLENPLSQEQFATDFRSFILGNNKLLELIEIAVLSKDLKKFAEWMLQDDDILKSYLVSIPLTQYREKIDEFYSSVILEKTNDKWKKYRSAAFEFRKHEPYFCEIISKQICSSSDAWFASYAISYGCELAVDAAARMLAEIIESGWDDHLLRLSWPVLLATQVKKANNQFHLGFPLRQALFSAIGKSLDQSVDLQLESKTINELIDILTPILQRGLQDSVYESVLTLNVMGNQKYWEVVGPLLEKSIRNNISGQKEGAGRRIFIALVKRHDVFGIAWLNRAIVANGSVWELTNDQAAVHELAEISLARANDASANVELRDALSALIERLPKREIETTKTDLEVPEPEGGPGTNSGTA